MHILIVDKLSAAAVTALEQLGLQVSAPSGIQAESLPAAAADADILVVRSTKVTAATIDAAPRLSLIVRAGAGVDTIDMAAASCAEFT